MDNMLAVPVYQRPYAWEREQVSQLLDDLRLCLTKDGERAEYFLGSIVLAYQDRERAEVVDGQQRLVTASIMLAAIRNYFVANRDIRTAELVESRFLLARHIRTLQVIPRLQLNERDNDFFVQRVLSGERGLSARGAPDSHKRIVGAADLAAQHVEAIVAQNPKNPREALIDWVTFLEKRVRVIVVDVPDHSDAFTIFETLNDRGADMDVTDLLKNHLLRLAGSDRLIEVDRAWSKVLTTLEAEGPRAITDFVRHLWSSRYGLTRERQLYSSIRSSISSRNEALGFARELVRAVPLYAAILDSEHVLWDELGHRDRHYIAALNRIGVVAMRPLLLAILQDFQPRDISEALQLLVCWAVRLFVVGSLGSGALESMYSDLAVWVRARRVRSADELRQLSIAPTDAEFEHAFAGHSPRKPQLAKYWLCALEMHARGNPDPVSGSVDEQEPTILSYIGLSDDDLGIGDQGDNIMRLLGNTILLEARLAEEVRGKDYATRRKAYARSQFKLTRDVGTARQWDLESVLERQGQLARLASRVWTL